jgi:hypothetical protein
MLFSNVLDLLGSNAAFPLALPAFCVAAGVR